MRATAISTSRWRSPRLRSISSRSAANSSVCSAPRRPISNGAAFSSSACNSATRPGRPLVLLRVAFTVAPILFGLDKFLNVMVDWEQYLAPWIDDIIPGSASFAMHLLGVIEIVAGVFVFLKPRNGASVVAAWLAGIIVNRHIYSGYYDIALRDFGLMLGALTLARLAWVYDPPGSEVRI